MMPMVMAMQLEDTALRVLEHYQPDSTFALLLLQAILFPQDLDVADYGQPTNLNHLLKDRWKNLTKFEKMQTLSLPLLLNRRKGRSFSS